VEKPAWFEPPSGTAVDPEARGTRSLIRALFSPYRLDALDVVEETQPQFELIFSGFP
jgi:hypothetical protein